MVFDVEHRKRRKAQKKHDKENNGEYAYLTEKAVHRVFLTVFSSHITCLLLR